MTDRELLELAAKAAGYTIVENGYDIHGHPWFWCNELERNWDALEDDGDALRLAVKLNIAVHPGFAYTPTGKLINYRDHANRIAATRRAIVRAAAEIGKEKR